MDEPTDIPEGSEIELVIADDDENLDEKERERLHRALRKSWASAKRGDTRPVREIMRAAAGNVQEIRDPEQGETGRTRPPTCSSEARKPTPRTTRRPIP